MSYRNHLNILDLTCHHNRSYVWSRFVSAISTPSCRTIDIPGSMNHVKQLTATTSHRWRWYQKQIHWTLARLETTKQYHLAYKRTKYVNRHSRLPPTNTTKKSMKRQFGSAEYYEKPRLRFRLENDWWPDHHEVASVKTTWQKPATKTRSDQVDENGTEVRSCSIHQKISWTS